MAAGSALVVILRDAPSALLRMRTEFEFARPYARDPLRRDQPLGLERFLHLRPGLDAVEIGLQVRPLANVHLDAPHPAQHREQISVRDRELVAHEILLAGELRVEPIEAL